MPIRPENRLFYPIDWAQLSDVIRFGRAKGCCEGCGRPHGQLVFHLGDGRWWDATGQTWRSGKGRPLKLAPLECLPAGTVLETTRVYLEQAPTRLNRLGFRLGQRCDSMSGFPRRRADGGCLVR